MFGPLAPASGLADGSARKGPCPMNCTNDNEMYSFHSGGVNAVFADGSVHFLRASMTLTALSRLITQTFRHAGLLGSTNLRSTGAVPKIPIVTGSFAPFLTPS